MCHSSRRRLNSREIRPATSTLNPKPPESGVPSAANAGEANEEMVCAVGNSTVNGRGRIALRTTGELLRHRDRDCVLGRGQIEKARIADVVRIDGEQGMSLDIAQVIDREHHARMHFMLGSQHSIVESGGLV